MSERNDIIISFVIPVYNQAEYLEKWMCILSEYEGNDIELVVADDGSSDNLEDTIKKYQDNRVNIFRNKERVGQDRNILYGISKSKGKYIWLFRTKDFVIPSKIRDVIQVLNNNKDVSWLTGSCVDEDGKDKIKYEEDISYNKGKDALVGHFHLYQHPSGCIYRKEFIEVERLDSFLREKTDAFHFIYLFSLMRLSLSQKGSFICLRDVIWVYSNTEKARTISANRGGKYIYDPDYNYMRLAGEFAWAHTELDGEARFYAFARIFGWYLMQVTWVYYLDVSNLEHTQHYGIEVRKVEMDKERNQYLDVVNKLERQYSIDNADYYLRLKNCYLQKNKDFCLQILQKND